MLQKQNNKPRTKSRKYKGPYMTEREKLSVNQFSSYIANDMGAFAPEQLFVQLHWPDVGIRTNNASSTSNWRYRTSAFDVDPLLGGTAIAGFAELATFYGRYRVHGIGIETHGVNMSTSPMVIGVWPSNEDRGNNGLSGPDIYNYARNPGGALRIIQPTPYGIFNHSAYFSLTEILGSDAWVSDDGWQSLTNTNPTLFVFLNIGLGLTTGTLTTTGGYHHTTSIVLFTEFFGRRTLTS
jgi:hypothetical protein